MFQHPRTFHSSYYKSFGATRHAGMSPAPNHFTTVDNSSSHLCTLTHKNIDNCSHFTRSYRNDTSTSTKLIDSTIRTYLTSLVHNIQNDKQKRDLLSLLMRFYDIFDITRHNIARTLIPHVIITIPHSPPARRPYPQPDKEEAMYKLIQEFLEADLISESNFPYAAPPILVKKKDQSYRFVVDYKRLNAITIKDSSPLPNMEDTIQNLGKGFSYFSKLDLKSDFYQIPINDKDKEKTAFVTPFGLYQFNVLPMGLRNSPPTFQKVMTDTLKSCRQFSLAYLDDIIVFSRSFSDHLNHLHQVFLALQAKNFVLNPPKCEIAVSQIDYLGHSISNNGIKPMKEKIDAILRIQEPRTLAQANRFLGALGWYRKFLPKFADVAASIHAVTNLTKPNRKKFKWEISQSEAFRQLKQMLITEPLFLHYPVDDVPLILTTDASDIQIGGVLQQELNGNIHNLYYHSQLMTTCEKKYSAIEKEALAIYKCLERMRSFVLGRNIVIMTDHCPLCYIMHKSIKNARVNRITHLIQEYNIDKIVHIRGRYNCLPDYLSRYSKEQDDDLFNAEYGLASKNKTEISNQQNVLAAMTLRPRKHQTKSINDNEAIENHTDSRQEFDTVSHNKNAKKRKVTPNISYNYFDTAKLQIEQERDPQIQKIISKLQNAQHNNWNEFLPAVVFAYNTGIHKSTKFSPFELLYGRSARLPIHVPPKHFTFLKPNDYFEQLKKTLQIFHEASRDNILLQQQVTRTFYNKNRLNPQLTVGQKVLTRMVGLKAKLEPTFSPIPKVVVEVYHPIYIVEDERTHYPQLRNRKIIITSCIPCFKISKRFSTIASLMNNIDYYNHLLFTLSNQYNFLYFDLQVPSYWLGKDMMHVAYRNHHYFTHTLLNYINSLHVHRCLVDKNHEHR
ncbi:unnamed protein product [Rotaria sp. Silwood2]|nr:unnamed protein product [Rotaria sp. Silwood2]